MREKIDRLARLCRIAGAQKSHAELKLARMQAQLSELDDEHRRTSAALECEEVRRAIDSLVALRRVAALTGRAVALAASSEVLRTEFGRASAMSSALERLHVDQREIFERSEFAKEIVEAIASSTDPRGSSDT